MTEPTITCPHCQREIRLTESLAGPLLAAARQEFEQLKEAKETEYRQKEASLRTREDALEERVEKRLREERTQIAQAEAQRARRTLQDEFDAQHRQLADLEQALREKSEKLGQAQQAQAEALKKERALQDAQRELELTVERRVQEGLVQIREQARSEAETRLGLSVQEKEETIRVMQRQIEELRRRAEQGSQQLQGEVLELNLESSLRTAFPGDVISEVGKGQTGADLVQRVVDPVGRDVGTILWETKRTKAFSKEWLEKLRRDQRDVQAELAILVSQALPEEITTFAERDGVWLCSIHLAVPLALALRAGLLETAGARRATQGQKTKMELLYSYLCGTQFRQRVEAILEGFNYLKNDLEAERRAMLRRWASREKKLELVLSATLGMHGDLQGIAGASIPEIDGSDLGQLPEGEEV